ncbi:CCA tRNA nucleotidyltransferase [bacterium]|nr:CCA tRNA nucleotidyltransferase [bacterium]
MKSVKIAQGIARALNIVVRSYSQVTEIVQSIDKHGGKAFLVGGAVRDLLLERVIKDLDIEVHGLDLQTLETILKKHGPVSSVGKAFGVLRLHGLDVDWSLPRVDAAGRKPNVSIDPHMELQQAFKRRDLTINAMGIDLVTLELIDPFDGLLDLKNGVLRAPDKELFVEDPLRLFRVMQFIGRFEMKPNDQLNEICASMDISSVSVERIEKEFEKLLLKSKRPSFGFAWLQKIGRLQDILPELHAVINISQDSTWHPEGEVFEHTKQSIDAAAIMSYKNNQEKLIVMLAVLCHDLGKVSTTEKVGGTWKSLGHSQEGVPFTRSMLKRITKNQNIVDTVCKLVRHHMAPTQLVGSKSRPAAYKRLAKKLAPHATITMLAKVSLADKRGRNPIKGKPLVKNFPAIEKFLSNAQNVKVHEKPEAPVLQGRDLLDIVKPGPQLGELLKKAYDFQIQKGIKDKDELRRLILEK